MLSEVGMLGNVIPVDITAAEQFSPSYVSICPNSKVPAIVDHDGPKGTAISVFESGAILLYLAEKTGQLMPNDPIKRMDTLQWLMFQMGGVGPMLGQAHHFRQYAPEHIEYAIERYTNEAGRLYRVLDRRLESVEFLGEDYSIADIATFPWIRTRKLHGQILEDYPNVYRWYQQIKARPAVQAGLSVLSESKRWEAKPGTKQWSAMFNK